MKLLASPVQHLMLPPISSGSPTLNTVHHADALSLLRALPDGSIDICFADPPYNNGTRYDIYVDRRSDYSDWCRAWFKECRRVARVVVITPGHGNLWMWGQIEKPFGVGCWYKPGNCASSVMGWETWEPWLYYGSRILGGPSDVYAPVFRQTDVGDHPCPKPVQLLTGILRKVGKAGCSVIDPFCGTGTTLIAASKLAMHYIGADISATYVQIAKRRLAQPYTLPLFTDAPQPAPAAVQAALL